MSRLMGDALRDEPAMVGGVLCSELYGQLTKAGEESP
jgi:hypothetical protein